MLTLTVALRQCVFAITLCCETLLQHAASYNTTQYAFHIITITLAVTLALTLTLTLVLTLTLTLTLALHYFTLCNGDELHYVALCCCDIPVLCNVHFTSLR